MRAREFTINVPITIKINGDNEPEIDMGDSDAKDPSELEQNPVMVPPLQQEIEMKKSAQGKSSPIIKDLTQDEVEHDPDNPIFQK